MTQQKPNPSTAADLAKAWERLVATNSSEYHDKGRIWVTISPLKSLLEQTMAMLEAQRQTIENAQAEIYSVWSHGGNLNALQLNHLEAAMKELSKLEADSQPKQEQSRA